MDISSNILEVLKCSNCENYLSRSPVYMRHNGAATCGACHSDDQPANRNVQYECVAQLLRFPCRNRDLGCPDTVPFVHNDQEIPHEAVCEFRQYVCPVMGSSHCDWLGTRSQILQHCRADHPDHVLDNPCSLVHDITSSSLSNYIVSAFHMLFLLHTKVCVTTGKILHAIRLLDASYKAADFFFTLIIKRGDEELKKKGQVADQGLLVLQEPTALTLDINSLLSFLGGWNDVTFSVTLEALSGNASGQTQMKKVTSKEELVKKTVSEQQVKKVVSENQQAMNVVTQRVGKCTKCGSELMILSYHGKNGWTCDLCAPVQEYCKNLDLGCIYYDIPIKHLKHEKYFCEHKIICICQICEKLVKDVTIMKHYTDLVSQHEIYKNGDKWKIWSSGQWDQWKHCLLSSSAGTIVCRYTNSFERCCVYLFAPVESERLCEFRCTVQFTAPVAERIVTHTYTPDIIYNENYDWSIEIKNKDFLSLCPTFEICVDIQKI